MNRIFNLFTKWPKATIALVLLLSVPFGYAFTQKSFRNHVTLYFEADDPAVLAYEQFKKMYGNEEAAIIVVHAEDIFTDKILAIVRDISSMAKAFTGVQRVFSLTEATEAIGRDETISFEPIVPRGALDAEQLKAVRQHVLAKEFYTQTLVSKNGDTAAVIVELEPIASAEEKGAILNHITAEAERIAGKDARLYFSGPPFVEYEINSLTQRDDKVFTPIVIAMVFLLAALLLKSISLASLCLVNVFLTLIWSVGIFVLTGHRFSMVTVVMPPMILAITVADAIHILSHFKALYSQGKSRLQSIFHAAANLWFPCLFTSLTTAVGFLSFLTTDIDPLRTLGLFTFIGVMLAYIMTIMILPAFMAVFIRKPPQGDGAAREGSGNRWPRLNLLGLIERVGAFTLRHTRALAIAMVLVMAVALVGAFQIRYETNFANHLDETNRIKQGIRFIESKLFGTVPVALLIRAKSQADDFTHPESVKLIEALQTDLKREFQNKYSSFFSVGDYFKAMHQAFNQNQDAFYVVPDNPSDILDYYELGEADILDRIISRDKMEARISFNAYLGPISGSKQLERYLDASFAQGYGDRYVYQITGSSALYAAMDQNLKECLYRSFSLAFLIIFGMMHLVCRNWKLTLISVLPNLFPILCTFGLMGYLDIPLDVSTIMIASITIGIAVDDTIHFLVWYRRNALSGMETEAALRKTFTDTGKPILITSIILCVSFFSFMAGSVLPVRAFGVLTGMSMAFAFIGDMLLLPAMIMLFRPDLRTNAIRLKRKWYPVASGKGIGLFFWFVVCCMAWPLEAASAAELQTFGFIELDNLVNTYSDQDFADAVKKNEIRANLEVKYGRDDLHLFMKSDFYYAPNLSGDDDPYDYRYAAESEVANNLRISGNEYEADFNELYLNYRFSPFRLRLGNQLYKWGTADVLNPTAYFNPYDFREFLLRDDDQFKQGVPSLSAMYFHDGFTTELVFAFAHVPTLFAPSGNFWSLDMRNALYTSRVGADDSLPVEWENTGIGGRISATVWGTDLSLSAYHGPDRDPVMVPESVAFPPNEPLLLTIEPRYHIVNMVGLDFSKTVGDFVFQAEAAFSPNKRSLVMQDLSGPGAVQIPFDTRESDFISYAAGFNYFVPTGKIFENHGGETVFTVDWYQARYADDDLYGAYFTDLLTLRLQDTFMDGRLLFKYTAMFETQHNGSIHWPELTLDFQNGWALALAYVAIDGDLDGETFEPLFYHYRNNDFVSFKIRYQI